jgi:long-chain acyl-CoA synthetase
MTPDFSQNRCLAEALRQACEQNRSRLALIESDRDEEKTRWKYDDVLRESDRLASLMIEKGFKPGDRCILLMPNQSRWVVSAAAVVWAGGVIIPIDVKLKPEEQAALITYAEPKMIIADAELWKPMKKSLKGSFQNLTAIVVNSSGDNSDVLPWETLPEKRSELPRLRDRKDIATIIFTSGTGGDPKGCMISDGAYLNQMESILKVFPITSKDRYLSIVPANHVMDFMSGFLLAFVTGSSVIHQRTLRSQYIVETLKKYKITYTAMVPLILRSLRQGICEAMEKLPPAKKKLLNILRAVNVFATKNRPLFWLSSLLLKPIHDRFGGCFSRMIVGGTTIDKELIDFFYQMGFGVHIGYGLTEVCTVIALNDLHPYRGDTVGRVLPGGRVEIRDGRDDGVGEIWIKAPFLMSGYFKNDDLTARTIVNGWLRTGDLGTLGSDGHLKLVGRSKNMIVTDGGKNVYPEDIETAFHDVEECDEYCVFASHYVWPRGEKERDRLILVVRPKDRVPADAEFAEKIRHANRQLDNHKRIAGYLVWTDPFPRTASLKIKRERLADAIRDGGVTGARVVSL